MKPDWNDAPKWANYLAMDQNGEWWWYEKKPEAEDGQWKLWRHVDDGFGNAIEAKLSIDWKKTLEHRPE